MNHSQGATNLPLISNNGYDSLGENDLERMKDSPYLRVANSLFSQRLAKFFIFLFMMLGIYLGKQFATVIR